MHKIGVLVSGRGSNLQAIMDRIADGYLPLEIAVVISDKPDAFALERAQKADIKTVAVERKACASKEEFEAKINAALEAEGCELVVLAGFMRILSADFVNKWQHKIINIHPALLPKYGGKGMYGDHVHKAVRASGDTESGITIHYVNKHYDEGAVVFQATCAIEPSDSYEDIARKVHALEYEHFPKVIEMIFG